MRLNSTYFVNSTILTQEKSVQLLKLTNFPVNSGIKLLYQASRDGFSTVNFTQKCQNQSGTLTVVKVQNSSNIFGGYTRAAWATQQGYRNDSNAFLFSLVNQYNLPTILNVTNSWSAIYSGSGSQYCMPFFGYGISNADLFIADQSNMNQNSFSNLGQSYRLPMSFAYGSAAAQSFLAGSFYFQVNEIEVYLITGKKL